MKRHGQKSALTPSEAESRRGLKHEILNLPLLRPQCALPPGVVAAMTLRTGGVSQKPFDSLNLSFGVGDDAQAVHHNRSLFARALGARPVWLRQVHGSTVKRLHAGADAAPLTTADAAWTSQRGLACTVGAADCMPVLFALHDGSAVAAAHAGWRGLAAGVLPATLRALCEGMSAQPKDCTVWLGPCIGPLQFQVGAEVLLAFGADPACPEARFFTPSGAADGSARWLANLPALALAQLRRAGVTDVVNSGQCTFSDPSNFFSYRRDGITGRHAAAIGLL